MMSISETIIDSSERNNPKVELHEQTNFKELDSKMFCDVDLFVCDVSFISLKQIINKIFAEKIKAEMICLIKPQFECGKDIAKKFKGVILDKKIHFNIVCDLFKHFNDCQFYVQNMTVSPIKGGDGNIEYLIQLSNKINQNAMINVKEIIDSAFDKKKE